MHILGAIMLAGGTIYLRCIHVPAKLLTGDLSEAHLELQRKLWSRMVMIASAQLLISGIVNVILTVQYFEFDKSEFPGNAYHPLLGVKFLLAMVIFFLAAALAGRSGLAQKLRQKEKMWLTVNMVLAIVLVCIAGVMRLAPRSPKSATSFHSVEQSAEETATLTFEATTGKIS
jgi:putative copper export protein